jgi:hypothetical protein
MKTLTVHMEKFRNVRHLKHELDRLMAFPRWYGNRMDEWIDMVSLSEREHPLVPYLTSRAVEHFVLELVGDDLLSDRQHGLMKFLTPQTMEINQRYEDIAGRHVITLSLVASGTR